MSAVYIASIPTFTFTQGLHNRSVYCRMLVGTKF